VGATAGDGRRTPGGHRFGGFDGWPGEPGFGLGDHGRSFGGAPWPGGFAGCPGLGLPCLGSDMHTSVGSPESTIPVRLGTKARICSMAPVPGVPIGAPKSIGELSFPLS